MSKTCNGAGAGVSFIMAGAVFWLMIAWWVHTNYGAQRRGLGQCGQVFRGRGASYGVV